MYVGRREDSSARELLNIESGFYVKPLYYSTCNQIEKGRPPPAHEATLYYSGLVNPIHHYQMPLLPSDQCSLHQLLPCSSSSDLILSEGLIFLAEMAHSSPTLNRVVLINIHTRHHPLGTPNAVWFHVVGWGWG